MTTAAPSPAATDLGTTAPRLRHLVIMSDDLDGTAERLTDELGLTDPFSDPIAGEFGLRNQIFTMGDCFLEVCEPVDPEAAGQRFLDRSGPGGYMVITQVPDLTSARARLDRLGLRVVWEGSRDGIAGMHVHPQDLPGTIPSLDQATPPETWAWGGPDWEGGVGRQNDLRLLGATIAVPDPEAAAARWAAALDSHRGGAAVTLGPTTLRFASPEARTGLVGIDLAVPSYVSRGRVLVTIAGVRFGLHPRTTA